jgi:hypothetical protein
VCDRFGVPVKRDIPGFEQRLEPARFAHYVECAIQLGIIHMLKKRACPGARSEFTFELLSPSVLE